MDIMKITLKIFIFLIAIAYVGAEYVNYKHYKVYNVVPETENDVELLKKMKDEKEFMFWMDVGKVGLDVRIMVHPEKQEKFERTMAINDLKAVLFIDDVQRLIDEQLQRPPNVERNEKKYNWTYYQTLEEVYDWMDEIATEYSNIVTIEDIGRSVENRPIKGIKIDFKKKENPVIGMFEGTLHAREWITTATLTWIIKEFLTSEDEHIRFLAENVVWHIFPVTNPDGYKYSFTTDRMWRKNRNRANFKSCSPNSDERSAGVDLNRNFGFHWMGVGASSNPCDITYAGPRAFSEPESIAIANHVMKLKQEGNLLYYFSMHSYSQMILVPYSHVGGADVLQVPNYGDMFEMAIKGADKLGQRYNTSYTVGTSVDVLYAVTGSGFDWVKGVAEVPLVFLYELRDKGRYGFLLPTDQIIPNGEEVMDSLIEIDKVARQIGYYSDGCSIKISATLLAIALVFSLRL